MDTSALNQIPTPKPIPRDFDVLMSRSMFMKGRPYVAPVRATNPGNFEPPAVLRPEKSLVFNGVTDVDDTVVALIEDINAGRILDMHNGDTIAQGKVQNITLDRL